MNTPYFTTEILAEAAQAEQNFGLFEFFQKGGPLMWVLLVFSILAFMAIFVCSWITRASSILPKNMVENVENYIRRKDYAPHHDNASYRLPGILHHQEVDR
jgi:biopolymer transport protein ExbB/TolQ